MDVEAEIRDLKRRVGELEGSFTFLNQQVRAVHTDLLQFQKAVMPRLDGLEQAVRSLRHDLPHIVAGAIGEAQRSLRDDLPSIIANAVGEILRR